MYAHGLRLTGTVCKIVIGRCSTRLRIRIKKFATTTASARPRLGRYSRRRGDGGQPGGGGHGGASVRTGQAMASPPRLTFCKFHRSRASGTGSRFAPKSSSGKSGTWTTPSSPRRRERWPRLELGLGDGVTDPSGGGGDGDSESGFRGRRRSSGRTSRASRRSVSGRAPRRP